MRILLELSVVEADKGEKKGEERKTIKKGQDPIYK